MATDVFPAGGSSDLIDLLLTLGVFEIVPRERRQWLEENSEVTSDRLWIQGDGAQSSLELVRLKQDHQYSLKVYELEKEGFDSYLLERLKTGWRVLHRDYQPASKVPND